jgi:(1->4)-alpha-D-glucan 1-alpha-D-glucosylmutase
MATPCATYRLQFRKEFGFDDAAAIMPYLAKLGISHLYASPYLKARPGSTHGYDIVDHDALNPELGGDEAYARMVAALRQHDLKQILDFVPNHMGVGGADNPFWLDVLEWGVDSEYAGWFDIDWDPDYRYLRGKLLMPFLGEQYGVALQAGQLVLKFDAADGGFALWAYEEHKLPISPLTYARILGDAHPELERLGDGFSDLANWRAHAARRARDLKMELASLVQKREDVRDAVNAALGRMNGNPGDLSSWHALDRLVQRQHWRLAHFRVAGDDINYRRFFNINDLAGLRMELPELFEHAHRLVVRLLADGTLDGLRIDHIDGLLDPRTYLRRLRAAVDRPYYLAVEKILAPHESLRDDWPVDGTTGYEFANLCLGLLIDPAAESAFTQTYENFTGQNTPFAEIVRDCKIRITENEMASELNVLARDAARIARQNPMTADFTRNIINRAIKQVVACFPVYRTYIDGSKPTEADRRDLDWALTLAQRHEREVDESVFDFLAQLLSTDLVAEPGSGFSRQSVIRCAMKLQQYSGPVMAKGLEDTAFYRYNRFVAMNEVGGRPDQFGVTLSAFHKTNAQRARHWPRAMLGTSTHDTKRGEDTRARLAALSELPEEWAHQVQTWSRILRARRGDIEGTAPPDRNDEYLFYQLLVGSWPAELTGSGKPPAEAMLAYAERIKAAMVKSIREAKLHSNWAAPDTAYEDAILSFVQEALNPERSDAFMDSFLPFQERVAELGMRNGLVQTTLKLTLPGVPDIYQGAELWDLSLVDPDNRRPVDFTTRSQMLQDILGKITKDRAAAMRELLAHWQDGGIKLAITATLLQLRRDKPELFANGSYEALDAQGSRADQICAFTRRDNGRTLLVAAMRFLNRLEMDPDWHDTRLPAPAAPGWTDQLTGRRLAASDQLDLSALFADLPVAVLIAE